MLNGEAVELSFNAAEEGDALVAYYEISQDGEYDLSVTVKDAQGNKATKKYADIDGNEVDMLSFALDTTAPEVLYGIAFEDGISDVVSGRYNDSIIGGEDYYYAVFNQSFRDAIISLKLDDLTGIDLENSYIIVLNSAGKSCLVMLSDDAFIKDIEHGIYDLSFNNLCANGDFDAADTDAWFRISSLYIKDFANHVSEFESEPKFAFDVTAPAVSCTTSPAAIISESSFLVNPDTFSRPKTGNSI